VFKVIFFSLGFAEKKKQWRIKDRIQTNGLLTAMMRTEAKEKQN
jgi:hypothetical protein